MARASLLRLAAAALLASVPASPQTTVASSPELFFQRGKIRTLILSGRNNHDWRATTPFLRKVLENTGRFDVRVTDEPSGLSAAAVAPYDLFVLNYCGPRWGPEAEQAVERAVRTGKGLVVIHAASYPFGDMEVLAGGHGRTGIREEPWKEYFEMTGAKWTEGPPRSGHGRRHVFEVRITDREHPITAGLAPSFRISDELYHRLILKDGVRILATAYSDPETKGTGRDEPVLWTLRYGEGRVFHTILGHDLGAMYSTGFITTLARGAEWAATGKVTLPAEIGPEPAKRNLVRVELVVGGHDFAPSLMGVFEGWDDLETSVVWQPDAYEKGRLNRADVIVQYDMVQAITEEAKANLVRHLEEGKGLVVLHHALVSYQDWPWWWKEVVGARYVREAGEGLKPSSYKHGVRLATRTVKAHPVTRGVPDLYIVDETYKDMWFSPEIEVLIRTDHPAADGPLVWIGPYRKARVAVIQLGHGPEAHRHPHFRKLVHNAILWAAGRLP